MANPIGGSSPLEHPTEISNDHGTHVKGVEDAAKVWEETVGESWDAYAKDGETFELDDRRIWRVSFESKEDAIKFAPSNAEITHDGDAGYWQARATQEQWIEKIGRGWFCSENW